MATRDLDQDSRIPIFKRFPTEDNSRRPYFQSYS